MASSAILLKDGIILQHDDSDNINVLRDTDLLIESGMITKIGKYLRHADAQVIDCRDKIIAPGFVDTHHHMWQTPLKGCHSDDTLLDYFPKGNLQQYNFTSEDIFWSELGGMLEALDGGTTCIVDHAHMTHSVDQAYAGVAATIVSGIRSIFCYTAVPSLRTWTQEDFELDLPKTPEDLLESLGRVKHVLSTTGGRVRLGLGFDSFSGPEENIVKIYEGARAMGVQLISSHWHRTNLAGSRSSTPQVLKKLDLLGSDVLIAHANGSTDEEFASLREAGVYVSSTPATETQMGHGEPMAFRRDVLGALGVDCKPLHPYGRSNGLGHSSHLGSMLDAMRLGMAVARCSRNAGIVAQGKFPRAIAPTTLEAFNLATIGGARAVGMADHIGSLVEGKRADVVVYDTSSPRMICAADENPLVAVVRHATPQDIELTIVGGRIRKRGRVLDPSLLELPDALSRVWSSDEKVRAVSTDGQLPWEVIAKQLRKTRAEVLDRSASCSMSVARKQVVGMWKGVSEEEILL